MAKEENLLSEALFGGGAPPRSNSSAFLKQYEIYIGSFESALSRKRFINAFFVSASSLLLGVANASGVFLKLFGANETEKTLAAVILLTMSLMGLLLCGVWWMLLAALGNVCTGKLAVIKEIEMHLPIRLFRGEQLALKYKRRPERYLTEEYGYWLVPFIFFACFCITLLAFALGYWQAS